MRRISILLVFLASCSSGGKSDPVEDPGVHYTHRSSDNNMLELLLYWDKGSASVSTGTAGNIQSHVRNSIQESEILPVKQLFTPELMAIYQTESQLDSYGDAGVGVAWLVSVKTESLVPNSLFAYTVLPAKTETQRMLSSLEDFAQRQLR